jgi:hypothetical protein
LTVVGEADLHQRSLGVGLRMLTVEAHSFEDEWYIYRSHDEIGGKPQRSYGKCGLLSYAFSVVPSNHLKNMGERDSIARLGPDDHMNAQE